MTRVRCAIYTRKSSEEGLEQTFNSLDAQREACLSYIESQRHEGWRAIPTSYDDGGFSGGTLDRPALTHLLADIEAGRVDTIVVYKVDRLDPLPRRLRPDRRAARSGGCVVRLGHPAVQYDQFDGTADLKCAAVLCAVRTGSDGGADPRQDRRLQTQGDVDGGPRAPRL